MPIHVAFLDSISHDALAHSLHFHQVPEDLIQATLSLSLSLYANPIKLWIGDTNPRLKFNVVGSVRAALIHLPLYSYHHVSIC